MDLNEIGAIATAVAAFIAVVQLASTARSARTGFEDELAREYRTIVRQLPMDALLGANLSAADRTAHLPTFFQYLDLCNQQVFLRMNGRVGARTWREWCEGIRHNLTLPTFADAWAEIGIRNSQVFNELRKLESQCFLKDPRSWVPVPTRVKQAVFGNG